MYLRTYEQMQDGGDLSLGKPPDPALKVLAKHFVCSDADVSAINPLLNVTAFVVKDALQLTVGARVRMQSLGYRMQRRCCTAVTGLW